MIYGNTWNYDTHYNVQLHHVICMGGSETQLYHDFVVFGIALLRYQINNFVYLQTSQAFWSIPIHSMQCSPGSHSQLVSWSVGIMSYLLASSVSTQLPLLFGMLNL